MHRGSDLRADELQPHMYKLSATFEIGAKLVDSFTLHCGFDPVVQYMGFVGVRADAT